MYQAGSVTHQNLYDMVEFFLVCEAEIPRSIHKQGVNGELVKLDQDNQIVARGEYVVLGSALFLFI